MATNRIQFNNPVHQLDWYLKQLALTETPEPLRGEYITESKRLIEKLDSACRVWGRASTLYREKVAKYEITA
jgi:hypothetical protein